MSRIALILRPVALVVPVAVAPGAPIGASGAPGGEKDEACARAGLATISDRLK